MTTRTTSPWVLLALALAASRALGGCELVTKFDRSKIDGGAAGASSGLVAPSDGGVPDASN